MDRQKLIMIAVLASALAAAGCARGDFANNAASGPDAGTPGPDAISADGGAPGEDGGAGESDPPVPTVAPSGGGATVETDQHRIRLIVAPRGAARSVETDAHRIRFGAGSAQHAQ